MNLDNNVINYLEDLVMKIFQPNFQSVLKACNRYDFSNTKFYSDLGEGLLPPVIQIGARRVTTLEHETSSIIAARANGANDTQIKTLVKELVEERSELLKGRLL